ncbi:probable alkaline/neutral invertase F isoform X2 [Jatropha curcas]|uniref:probable alkaline/neutral invertase F isoform X2 n=1 Tax=Jatropha curcas TaxID=180498 RepID=UPI0009D74590|nr:probable alkaline/neutral invertase F isoform X2 [Jatropha curcas]
MNLTVRDCLELDDKKQPEVSPPSLPAVVGYSSGGGLIDEQVAKEKTQLSSAKEEEAKESPVKYVVSANEEVSATDRLLGLKQSAISTSPIKSQAPEKSLGISEGSKSFAETMISSYAESFKTAEKLLSSDQDSPKLGSLEEQRRKSVEKGLQTLSKGEASKSEQCFVASSPEMTGGSRPEKAKKTVRLQGNEIVSDTMHLSKETVFKFTALKSCPSVGNNLEVFDLNVSPGVRSNSSGYQVNAESGAMVEEAWERLKKSYVYFKEKPVGTLAAIDPSVEALNYNQVFVRDFVPSGLAYLMKHPSEPEIVKNFLLKTLHLQGWEKRIDNFTLGEGVMPASFKVLYDSHRQKEILVADFGGSAIGRVAPVDSGFWWIILLRSYTKSTRDYALAELPEVQRGMKLILNLCLSDGFDTFPTLLCADGCSMIDRRMGIYGYPIEIQALFYFALRCAQQMLKPERDGKELLERIDKRITALSYHIQKYYWLDFTQLNNIYRYKTEEYSRTAVNKFNVIPESIPDWVFDFMPLRGGYLIGNVSPARMDFRWFLVGNCIAILSSLATSAQASAIMDLIEERWEDLIGEMPLKITYPALEGHEWRIVTGCDPKNTRWSYHNGGSWPVLVWLLAAASIKVGRPQIAKRAVELLEQRLSKDGWPEYYDDKTGRYVGKQARKYQTWSISGYLVAKMMIENPSNLLIISLEEDKKIAKPRIARSASF